MHNGEEVHGTLNNADASSGVAVVIYEASSTTVRTLASTEFLEITDYSIISAPGGDVHLFLGADATPGAGETVARGTVAANGGLAHNFVGTARKGAKGHTPWIVAPAGAIDVNFTGRITKV